MENPAVLRTGHHQPDVCQQKAKTEKWRERKGKVPYDNAMRPVSDQENFANSDHLVLTKPKNE